MEAVVEARETRRDGRIRKTRIGKPRAIELWACGGKAHPSARGATVHSTHAATVHSSHAAAKAASGESRRGKSKYCAERTNGQAVHELVVHPNSSFIELQRRVPSREEETTRRPNEPMIPMKKATDSDTGVSLPIDGRRGQLAMPSSPRAPHETTLWPSHCASLSQQDPLPPARNVAP